MPDGGQPDRLPHLAARIGADYADSFAACRELLATMFDLDTPSPEGRIDYLMDFALYDYGPIKLGTCRASASIMVRSPRTIAETGVDQFHVQFYRTNGFVLTLDGAERQVRPGDVCMLDLSRPVIISTDGPDNLSAIVARDLLLPLLEEAGDVHGLILPRDSEAAITVRDHLEEMWRLGAELTVAQGLDWSHATAALLASIVRSGDQRRATTRAEMRHKQFRAICRRIDRHIGDAELGPDALARQFFITRPTLYRLFEPHGGIGRYILGRRLTGAFRDLSDPDLAHEKIAEILSRWGLDSHTAAGRAFRTAWGMTPSQCRSRALELHRAGSTAGGAVFDIPPEMPANVRAYR